MRASGNQEKVWRLTYDAKMTPTSVAHFLGVSRGYVYLALSRRRAKLGLPKPGFPRVVKVVKVAKAPKAREWHDERPRDQKARVAAEVASGKRCKRCHLLVPCFDHGDRP